jgi:hypothetical protein
MSESQVNRYAITIDGETALIGTANELAVALDVLQGQHDRAVLHQLAPHLAEIIRGPAGLLLVLKSLSPDDQLCLIDAIGPALVGVIQEARHLRDLFATLSVVEVERRILETLGTTGLRTLIFSGKELAEVLEWLYGQCDQILVDLLGADYIRSIIRNADHLGLVLNSLEEAGQEDLIDKLGWERMVQLIADGRDLAFLLRALPPALSTQLLNHYSREQLMNLIGNRHDWMYLFHRLEPAEADYLLEKLGGSPYAA